jgi:uncharacterized membrane protein HdeD (DUF308 family)
MASKTVLTRIQWLVWIYIYGGLLAIVLGRFVGRSDDTTACWMTLIGGFFVAVGVVLIYVRSRLKETP